MNFDSVNYSFLLQDFAFAVAAGFAVGGINRLLSVFLQSGKIALWIRDMLVAFIFAVVVFSYVVSFANYPDVRIYHLLGALFGFLSFDFNFSKIFHKFLKNFLRKIKHKMLCVWVRLCRIFCILTQNFAKNHKRRHKGRENTDLKNDNNWVYNL